MPHRSDETPKAAIFFIPGSGVPDEPAEDKNYPTYVQGVMQYILDYTKRHQPIKVLLVLSGCSTNPEREGVTEAAMLSRFIGAERDLYQAICDALPTDGLITTAEIHDAVDLRQGLMRIRSVVAAQGACDVIVFSEMTRRWRARVIAGKILAEIPHKVVGIDFDHAHQTPERRIARLVELGSAMLSNISHDGWYLCVELPRRLKKIGYDAIE